MGPRVSLTLLSPGVTIVDFKVDQWIFIKTDGYYIDQMKSNFASTWTFDDENLALGSKEYQLTTLWHFVKYLSDAEISIFCKKTAVSQLQSNLKLQANRSSKTIAVAL